MHIPRSLQYGTTIVLLFLWRLEMVKTDITAWNEWKLDESHQNPVRSDMSTDKKSVIEQQIKAAALTVPTSIKRIDLYHVNNADFFHWAWDDSNCNGINDRIWKRSNGGDVAKVVASEIIRLRKFGLARKTGVAIDIGAHIGDTTIPISYFAAKTIAFDPSSWSYLVLNTNSVINPHLNIDTYNIAIGPTDGEIEFEYGTSDQCNGGVSGAGKSEKKSTKVKKPVVNLHQFLVKQYGVDIINQISYIKMDCEGFDSTVLESLVPMIEMMQTNKKPAIQIEYFEQDRIHADDTGKVTDRFDRAIQLLHKLSGNYTTFCTITCNTPMADCRHSAHEVIVQNKVLIDKATQKPANCPDIMAVPAHLLKKKKGGHLI